jgi:hypothetical protein
MSIFNKRMQQMKSFNVFLLNIYTTYSNLRIKNINQKKKTNQIIITSIIIKQQKTNNY